LKVLVTPPSTYLQQVIQEAFMAIQTTAWWATDFLEARTLVTKVIVSGACTGYFSSLIQTKRVIPFGVGFSLSFLFSFIV